MALSDDDLRALLELEEKATPEPWMTWVWSEHVEEKRGHVSSIGTSDEDTHRAGDTTIFDVPFEQDHDVDDQDANARFIVAARNNLRSIAEELLELRRDYVNGDKDRRERDGGL